MTNPDALRRVWSQCIRIGRALAYLILPVLELSLWTVA